jgi:hypothetical protein
VVFDASNPMHVQGDYRLPPSQPAWVTSIPDIPVECKNAAAFTVQWDVIMTNDPDHDSEFCVGVASNVTDKKWYFTTTKSVNDMKTVQSFGRFFNSGDVVRLTLERNATKCTLSATNITQSKTGSEFMHALMFDCSDALCPIVCISSPSQSYTMQSVAQTEAEREWNEWDASQMRIKTKPLSPPQSTWRDWDWWSSLFTRKKGGQSKMTTRKRLNKGCNATRRKIKRTNVKTTRVRKRLRAQKIKMNSAQ